MAGEDDQKPEPTQEIPRYGVGRSVRTVGVFAAMVGIVLAYLAYSGIGFLFLYYTVGLVEFVNDYVHGRSAGQIRAAMDAESQRLWNAMGPEERERARERATAEAAERYAALVRQIPTQAPKRIRPPSDVPIAPPLDLPRYGGAGSQPGTALIELPSGEKLEVREGSVIAGVAKVSPNSVRKECA